MSRLQVIQRQMGLRVGPFPKDFDYYFRRTEQTVFEEAVRNQLRVNLNGLTGGRLHVYAVFPDGREQDKGTMDSDETWTIGWSPKYGDCWFKLVPVW